MIIKNWLVLVFRENVLKLVSTEEEKMRKKNDSLFHRESHTRKIKETQWPMTTMLGGTSHLPTLLNIGDPLLSHLFAYSAFQNTLFDHVQDSGSRAIQGCCSMNIYTVDPVILLEWCETNIVQPLDDSISWSLSHLKLKGCVLRLKWEKQRSGRYLWHSLTT